MSHVPSEHLRDVSKALTPEELNALPNGVYAINNTQPSMYPHLRTMLKLPGNKWAVLSNDYMVEYTVEELPLVVSEYQFIYKF